MRVVYNDLKNLMDINIQKGGSTGSNPGSDGDYCCDRYDRSDNSFHLIGRRFGNQISDGIANPLRQMSERLKTFAEGDLDSEFPEYDAKDEVAEMIEMARKMADNLNVIISDSGKL